MSRRRPAVEGDQQRVDGEREGDVDGVVDGQVRTEPPHHRGQGLVEVQVDVEVDEIGQGPAQRVSLSVAPSRRPIPASRRVRGRVLATMSRPVALVIQHVEPEGPGWVAAALSGAGVGVELVRADRGQPVPRDVDGAAALVVMGGPMSAGSDDGFPTRRDELALLRRATEAGVPVLGICLGAQLLAVSAGARIDRLGTPEIGWGVVELTAEAASDPLFGGLDGPLTVLHWHGETFTLPAGAALLASTPACAHQAFRLGPCAWGLQFHLEVDEPVVEGVVRAFPEDAARAGGADAILRAAPGQLAAMAPARSVILERFARLAAASR